MTLSYEAYLEERWFQFFLESGLPKNICSVYAASFVRNRLQCEHLLQLGKSDLAALGVDAIGDQICILKHIKETAGRPKQFMDSKITYKGTSSGPKIDHDDINRVTSSVTSSNSHSKLNRGERLRVLKTTSSFASKRNQSTFKSESRERSSTSNNRRNGSFLDRVSIKSTNKTKVVGGGGTSKAKRSSILDRVSIGGINKRVVTKSPKRTNILDRVSVTR
uniref:SAM domain-containing protein n=1 Tax=Parastrongyloides trichosuri TaxID=131310 RepID=A0A0N4Z4C2_PARTI